MNSSCNRKWKVGFMCVNKFCTKFEKIKVFIKFFEILFKVFQQFFIQTLVNIFITSWKFFFFFQTYIKNLITLINGFSGEIFNYRKINYTLFNYTILFFVKVNVYVLCMSFCGCISRFFVVENILFFIFLILCVYKSVKLEVESLNFMLLK